MHKSTQYKYIFQFIKANGPTYNAALRKIFRIVFKSVLDTKKGFLITFGSNFNIRISYLTEYYARFQMSNSYYIILKVISWILRTQINPQNYVFKWSLPLRKKQVVLRTQFETKNIAVSASYGYSLILLRNE